MKKRLIHAAPLKLWGTWAGLAIGFIFAFLSYTTIDVLCEFGNCNPLAYFLPILPMLIGGVLGWGIHSLFR